MFIFILLLILANAIRGENVLDIVKNKYLKRFRNFDENRMVNQIPKNILRYLLENDTTNGSLVGQVICVLREINFYRKTTY